MPLTSPIDRGFAPRLDCPAHLPHRSASPDVGRENIDPMNLRVEAGKSRTMAARAAEILLYALIALALLLGGAPNEAHWRMALLCITASALVAATVAAGPRGAVARRPLLLRLALVLIVATPVIQLIPLPPGLWSSLPGRAAPAAVFDLLGTRGDWHPLSLTPRDTLFALLMLLPPFAAFWAASALGAEVRARCVTVFLAIVTLSILVGLVQLGSRGTTLDFYGTAHRGNLIGFFANRNHQGLMLAIAASFAITMLHRHVRERRAVIAWSAILSITFLTLAIGTISRAALGMTLLSLAITIFAFFLTGIGRRHPVMVVALALATGLVLYFLSASDVVGQALARFDAVKDDGRWDILQAIMPLTSQYFPWGSGMGSFVPVYAAIENLDNLSPYYLNRVHNDYIELFIEAGVPGLIALAVLIAAIGGRSAAILTGRRSFPPFGLSAMVAFLLIALHSIVDYPLRTQAIMVLFAIFLALLFAEAGEKKRVRVGSDDSERES